MTREGRDWTAKLRMQRDALAALEVENAWLDGEAVVPGEHGLPDFQALQNALGAGRSDAVTLFVFDLPFLDGYDLRDAPLTARRAARTVARRQRSRTAALLARSRRRRRVADRERVRNEPKG